MKNIAIEAFKNYVPKIIGAEKGEYAILIPLIERADGFHVLFEKRAASVPQPGEISLPGGRKEDFDQDAEKAAVRETCEELGLEPNVIRVITAFDTLVTPFNKVLYSYLAVIDQRVEFKINQAEVAELLSVPLLFFVETEARVYEGKTSVQRAVDFPFELIPNGRNYNFATGYYPTYFYEYNGTVIWGITAALMKYFADAVRRLIV